MPKRIQLKRTKGFRLPPGAVNVARPTKWGNPFRVGVYSDSPQECVNAYQWCIARFPVPQAARDLWRREGGDVAMLVVLAGRVRSVLDEIRGKDLACWCREDAPCHADVLLEIANEEPAHA